MCVIAVKAVGKAMFPEKTIRDMFKRNPDGAGIMWAENGAVHIHKGMMSVKDVISFVNTRDWTDVPVVLHFRIGTSGNKDALNCHPYPIGVDNFVDGECDLAFAHNGILTGYNPGVNSSINDTQTFNNKVLSKLPHDFLSNEGIVALIKGAIATNKLAFLDKNGCITTVGDFQKDRDYLYSNLYWKPLPSAWAYSTGGWSYPAGSKPATFKQPTLFDGKLNKGLSFDRWFKVIDVGDDFSEEAASFNKAGYKKAVEELREFCFVKTGDEQDSEDFLYDDKYEYALEPETYTIYRDPLYQE